MDNCSADLMTAFVLRPPWPIQVVPLAEQLDGDDSGPRPEDQWREAARTDHLLNRVRAAGHVDIPGKATHDELIDIRVRGRAVEHEQFYFRFLDFEFELEGLSGLAEHEVLLEAGQIEHPLLDAADDDRGVYAVGQYLERVAETEGVEYHTRSVPLGDFSIKVP